MPVTSVSRRAEPLSRAPGSVFVITNEDIIRSGKTTLPEILRLAPNLHVAQASSGNYGITARGFNHNSVTANKLQILIDGRSVYTPLYSGVFWDAQPTFLDDIERIEDQWTCRNPVWVQRGKRRHQYHLAFRAGNSGPSRAP